MQAKDYEFPCAFGTLFAQNVPHILENIFFSLNYVTYKTCVEVNGTWKDLLTSEPYQRKVKSLFKQDINNDECQLWHDARRGKTKEVRKLLSIGVLDVSKTLLLRTTSEESTPLFEAVDRGHKDVVQLLLNAGADPDKGKRKGRTPLNIASYYGHIDVVKMLLDKGAKPNMADEYGITPLYQAAAAANTEIVQLLLDSRANPNVGDTEDKFTPLHYAAVFGHQVLVQALLDSGADINEVEKQGLTALHRAAYFGREDAVQLLLNRGADPNKTDKYGRTALSLARNRGHIDIVNILNARGA